MPIATKSDFINLSSEKKTEELAKKISKKLKLGHVVFFVGEMGVGKTTFIRYLINNFQKQNGWQVKRMVLCSFVRGAENISPTASFVMALQPPQNVTSYLKNKHL